MNPFDFSILLTSQGLLSLVSLTFMEIVLGIDNIIFITLVANKLPPQDQARARNMGLLIAMGFRIVLLFGIAYINKLTTPFTSFEVFGRHIEPTGQGLILIGGGMFLLYKAVSEIHEKLEGKVHRKGKHKSYQAMGAVVTQIFLINIVFSFDSILTAIGLTPYVSVMILGVIFSIAIMMLFAGALGRYIDKHPSLQMLGLSFLIMIGFMLVAEGAHKCHIIDGPAEGDMVPKGYIYFAIFFSLSVEFLNISFRKKNKPVQLRGATDEAEKEGLFDEHN